MGNSVYIIILNWNGWKDTIECLESIQKIKYENYRLVIVENGSKDVSLNKICLWAKKLKLQTVLYGKYQAENGGTLEHEIQLSNTTSKQKIVIINNEENLGFAAGANVGIRYAISSGADYVWLLNNDTTVEQNALNRMINVFSGKEKYKGITPQIVHYENHDLIWSVGCDFTWYGKLKRYSTNQEILKKRSSVFPVSFITNCASVYSTELFKEVGLLSEDSFMGEDDYDFSMRLKKYSYKLACNLDAIVYHKIGQSFVSVHPIGHIYAEYLCRLISIKKHYSMLIWGIWLILFSSKIVKRSFNTKDLSIIKSLKLIKLLMYHFYKNNHYSKELHFEALGIRNSL